MVSFTEYMLVREGLLPARPPAKGLPRINATPLTQAQRRKLAPAARPAGPASSVAPSIPAVVPPGIIPQIKPGTPTGPAGIPGSWLLQ